MSSKRFLTFFVILLSLVSLFAEVENAYIYPLSSPLYQWVESAYLLTGLGTPSASKPWSGDEADMLIQLCRKHNPPEEASLLLDEAERKNDRLKKGSVYIHPSLSLSPELYAHSNSEEYNSEGKWVHGYKDRSPFLSLALELGFNNSFYTYCNLDFGWGRATNRDETVYLQNSVGAIVDEKDLEGDNPPQMVSKSYLYSLPFLFSFPKIDMLDIETPSRSIAAVGGDGWFLTLSKDRLKWSSSHIGSFIFDSHLAYQDYLRFKFYGEKLTLEYVLEFFDTDTRSNIITDGGEKVRLMMAHAISYRPIPNLLFTVSENIMYSTANLDFRHLNPSYIFHNLNNPGIFNAIAHAYVSYAPIRGLNLYTQFCLDQATAPTEKDNQAPAWGIEIGIEGAGKVKNGVLKGFLEFAYTTPELYRREKADFLIFQKYSTNSPYKKLMFFDYIGFPYGGDAIVIKAGGELEVGARTQIGFEGEYLIHGEMNIFSPHSSDGTNTGRADIWESTPTGEEEHTITLSLYGEHGLPDTRYWTEAKVKGTIDWTKGSKDKGDFQLSLGLTFSV